MAQGTVRYYPYQGQSFATVQRSTHRTGEVEPGSEGKQAMQNAAGWDEIAREYASLAEPFTRQFAQAALDLSGGIRTGENVIDIAAGSGALAMLAAKAGARVLAIDFSPGMVALLDARLRDAGFDATGCAARVMDGQALDIADATFDAAFSIFGVMLFPDPSQGLAELARVTRPGGRGIITVWKGSEGAGPTPLIFAALRTAFPDRALPAMPPAMLRLMQEPDAIKHDMVRAGFHDVTVHVTSGAWTAISADWVADSADRLYRFLPVYAELTQTERQRVCAVLRANLKQSFPTGEVRLVSEASIAMGKR